MEGFRKIGQIVPKNARDVTFSRLGLGFEKLDRGAFDPAKAYDKVAATGVKWIRIQSGWARTETVKGVYDFAWLDEVVDNLLVRGLRPWICLCYGNGLYSEMGKTVFGAVGVPPIFTKEEKQGWHNYVSALTGHFAGRVSDFEIWNEPDGKWCWKTDVSGEQYGRFMMDTAKAIRQGQKDAYIIGGSVCMRDLHFFADALETGAAKVIDALTFHEYTPDESRVFERVRTLSALCHRYNPNIEIIQGESGSQSRRGGAGALNGGGWTEEKQAKQLLRHGVADLLCGVKFSSYFSTMDMIEGLNGTVGDKSSYMDFGYFGILGAEFDENGVATGTYTEKKSYYALQNLASVFAGDVRQTDLPIIFLPEQSPLIFASDCTDPRMISGGFTLSDGTPCFAYWNAADLMTTSFASTVTMEIAGLGGSFRLIDPMSGAVFAVEGENIEKTGKNTYKLKHLPILDYPLLLVSE